MLFVEVSKDKWINVEQILKTEPITRAATDEHGVSSRIGTGELRVYFAGQSEVLSVEEHERLRYVLAARDRRRLPRVAD